MSHYTEVCIKPKVSLYIVTLRLFLQKKIWEDLYIFWGIFNKKKLFHLRLLDMRWL